MHAALQSSSGAGVPLAPEEIAKRYDCACAVAREAGAMMREAIKSRPANFALKFKTPQDYITETDGEIERHIRARFAKDFPEDTFIGEEGGGAAGSNLWVVDPIDGTANFARGIPVFCVSIAFLRSGRVEIGAIYDPNADELYAARRGQGATRNGRFIRVSGENDIAKASIEAGWSNRRPWQSYVDLVARIYRTGAQVRRAGSGALALAYVADGRNDAYCELHINAWDVLAGLLLIEEAGGWTNDFLAGDGLANGNVIVGSTPGLKDELCRLVGV